MFCVLEIGNSEKKEGSFYETFNPVFNRENPDYGGPHRGSEYRNLNMLVVYFLQTLMVSTGDFDMINTATYLPMEENLIFWGCWVVVVLVACVVFLNFIIAKASASYEIVNADLDMYIM